MKLNIKDLRKSYNKKVVLDGIDFTFEEGKIYGLLGRNGAGKTTLFNCLNDDIKCDSGVFTMEFDETAKENSFEQSGENRSLSQLSNAKTRPLSTDDIGYVLSTPTVPEFLTGYEFVKFFIDVNRKNMSSVLPIDSYFDYISIDDDDRKKLLKDYSHGMKNKMQMLVNIMAEPNILLLDEPLTSLDVVVAEEMKQLLRNIKTGRIIIFSTHILDLALDLCDEIVLLNHGKLESVEKSHLDKAEFKDRIIAALREDQGKAELAPEDFASEEVARPEIVTAEALRNADLVPEQERANLPEEVSSPDSVTPDPGTKEEFNA